MIAEPKNEKDKFSLRDPFILKRNLPKGITAIREKMQEAFFEDNSCIYCGNEHANHIYHASYDKAGVLIPTGLMLSKDGKTPQSTCWVRPGWSINEE